MKSFHEVCVYHVITLLTLNIHKDACQLFLKKVEKRRSRGDAPASPSCRLLWGHALQNAAATSGGVQAPRQAQRSPASEPRLPGSSGWLQGPATQPPQLRLQQKRASVSQLGSDPQDLKAPWAMGVCPSMLSCLLHSDGNMETGTLSHWGKRLSHQLGLPMATLDGCSLDAQGRFTWGKLLAHMGFHRWARNKRA